MHHLIDKKSRHGLLFHQKLFDTSENLVFPIDQTFFALQPLTQLYLEDFRSYNNNPNATPEEVKEIKSKILTGSAINLSQKITAPQQKVLPPKSQKYIEGKIYVDDSGNEARYENGTFVEIK